jgi:hypothetical protein
VHLAPVGDRTAAEKIGTIPRLWPFIEFAAAPFHTGRAVTPSEITAALGAAQRSGDWWRCRCPGPYQPWRSTLAIRDGDRGLIVQCFAGCDPRVVIAELRRRGLIEAATGHRSTVNERSSVPMLEPVNGTQRHFAVPGAGDAQHIALARRIWDPARKARGTPVAAYFSDRAIVLVPPPSLRWAPILRRRGGTYGRRWSHLLSISSAALSACIALGSRATRAGSGVAVTAPHSARSVAAPFGSHPPASC